MLDFFKKFKKETLLDAAIIQCHDKLKNETPGSDEYTKICQNILTLNDAKSKTEIDSKTKKLIITSLGGILLIMVFEKSNIITTKALSFIPKII